MKTLLFYGTPKEHFLPNRIYQEIKSEHSIWFYNSNRFIAKGKMAKLQIIESDHLQKIQSDHMILFLRKPCDLLSLKYIDPAITVVVNAQEREHISFVALHHLRTVTYGLSHMDTVTFSSREKGKVVIALQRSICTIQGTVIDPMEIPCVIYGEYRDFTVLAYVTLLLLLDELSVDKNGVLVIDWRK